MPLKLRDPTPGKTPNYHIRGTYRGIYVERTAGTADKRKAQAFLKDICEQIERGDYSDESKSATVAQSEPLEPTFADATLAYLKANGEAQYVRRIINELKAPYTLADKPLSKIDQMLLDSALCVLSDAIKDHECAPQRQTLSDKRLNDVLRFIEIHLSDPKLSIAAVAKSCGISPRYLSLLLKLHGTPFSQLVWEKRLQTARQWLSSSKPTDASVSEIAYRVGFKSAAHFSRMFKQKFKVSPRQYRTPDLQGAQPLLRESQSMIADGGQSRH